VRIESHTRIPTFCRNAAAFLVLVACADREQAEGTGETTVEAPTEGSSAAEGAISGTSEAIDTGGSSTSETTSTNSDVTGMEGEVDGDACTIEGCASLLGECGACCPDRAGEDIPSVSDGTCTDAYLEGDWECVLERMRDGLATKLEFAVTADVVGSKFCRFDYHVALLGDGTALYMTTDLRGFFVSDVTRVVLRSPEYFTDCLSTDDEAQAAQCFKYWFEDGEICEPFDCCSDPSVTWCE